MAPLETLSAKAPGPSHQSQWSGVLRRALVAMLAAWLLVAVTAGNICHHHTARSEATCSICHFGHQPAQPRAASQRVAVMVIFDGGMIPDNLEMPAGPALPRSPSRAPPAV
jgi:hypothetical protein